MVSSFLRKRRPQSSAVSATDQTDALRHSLSLPDLASPLLDPEAWEELPPLEESPKPPGRNRKASLVGSPGAPILFHRPFNTFSVNQTTDFRQSYTKWSGGGGGGGTEREGVGLGIGSMKWARKRGKGKIVSRLNVVVVGGKGVGKTSFINLFIDSLKTRTDASTPTPYPHPTVRLSSQTTTVIMEGCERTFLRLIDTPGLALGADPVQEKERERGVAGMMRMLEERFGEMMREESRIVRKATRGEDDLVHLVLYLIDARAVFRPAQDEEPLDWSCVGVFEDEEGVKTDAEIPQPALSVPEIEVIRRLSLRTNILPVLAHTDALTVSELEAVRKAVKRDLSEAFPGDGNGFGIFGVQDEDGSDTPLTPRSDEEPDPRPPTPASTVQSHAATTRLPYAIFAPEPPESKFVRKFAWGHADVMNPEQSDFLLLRDAVLGTQTKILRRTTREVLYERFRTEKLLAKQTRMGSAN